MKTLDFSNAKAIIKIRGKEIPVNTNRGTADDIRKVAGIKDGRQIMIEDGQGMHTLKENTMYSLPPRAKYKDSPAVRKAAEYSESDYSYRQYRRQDWCNEVIRQQIDDIEKNLLHEDIMVDDISNPTQLLIPHFKLPKETRKLNPGHTTTPLIIVLPDQYPFLPPVGFFLPDYIKAGAHSGFSKGYHGATNRGEIQELMQNINFRWYCSSVVADTWEPAKFRYVEDWKKGDNLWNIITLITEVMSDFSDD